jgi:DNA polymerase-3 subunit delta
MSPDALDAAIRQGQYPPLVFLFGEEDFLVEEALGRVLTAAVDESLRDFNFDVLFGSEVTLNEIVERAQAYPLMAERRVVVVKDIDRAFAVRGKPDPQSPFMSYLASPLESTVLVITAATGDFLKGKTGAKPPFDSLIKAASAVHFKKVYDREVPGWTSARIRARGKEIAADALELFVGYSGDSLRVVASEIEKLFTFVEDRKKITAEDVRNVVGVSRTYNVFELQKAVGARDLERSTEIAERMLRSGEAPQLMLTMLTRYFTIVWRLAELRTRMRDQNELARSVGVAPFFVGEYLATAGRYSPSQIQNAFEALLQADVALKSTNIDPSIALQMMLFSVIRGERISLGKSAATA